MAEADISDLEAATRIFMEPPNMITAQQRQAAENVILNFRKTKTPYVVCQQILEKSTVDMLLFEAADVIKRALIIEWDELQEQDKLGLRQYLLNYVLHRQTQPYVREKILQVIAIIIKRISITDAGRETRTILGQMEELLLNGDIQQRYLVCRIISAIMQEYVITIKSDDAGLTFSEHFKAKKQFELMHLRNIFEMMLNAIEQISKGLDLKNSLHANLLLEFLNIEEQILLWGYVSPLLPKRLIGIFETVTKDQSPSLRLNIQWERVMLNPRVIDLFFGVYWNVRDIPELQKKGLTCIVQLSTLNGTIFSNPQAKIQYIVNFLTKYLHLLASIQVKESEAIGFATIFRKALSYHPPNKNLPSDIVTSMLQHLFALTCTFAEGSANEDSAGLEDAIYNEALEKILEAWLLVLQAKEFFPREAIKEYSMQIFNKYLQCHLSAPNGIRNLTNSNSSSSFDCEDTEQSDSEVYKEQLIIIGNFARENPGHSLNILSKLLEEKTRQLQSQLQAMTCVPNQLNASSTTMLEALFEDIHWTILIAGHVVAMESIGEQPIIPSEIMQHSCEQVTSGAVDVTTSLKVLASPGQDINNIPNADAACDGIIRLVAAVFRLCDIENKAIEYKIKDLLSPEVVSNVMWFLNMWAEGYLFMLSEYYTQISSSLQLAFGIDTHGGTWTLNFILNKICINVQSFYTEKQVVNDSVVLFVSLVKRKHKCTAVFNSEHFKQIIQLRSLPIPNSTLIKGLVISASCVSDKELQLQYLAEILNPVKENFNKLEWQQAMDTNNFAGKSVIATSLDRILDEIKAAHSGAMAASAQTIYDIFEPILYNLADLMNLFHNYQSVVVQILQLLYEVVKNLTCLQTHKVYEICMNCIRVYVKHNTSRITSDITSEDDSLEDLMLLLNIINSMLSKNYFDIDGNDEEEQSINAAEVCIFGLQYLMPLISIDLLKYPTFCCKYYQTITFFVETKAYKVCVLQPELLNNMLRSVELGLRSFGLEIQSTCFDFLQIMATTVYYDRNQTSYMYSALMPFLRLLLEMIITQEVGSDNKNECSTALFTLICCYKDQYVPIVQSILQALPNAANAEKLSKEFEALINNLDLVNNRIKQGQFLERYDKFIVNISFMYN